ncbi:MAG: hypothetical protein ACOCWO_03345 [Candidatus Muiribacteriaceae bacterium]
MKKSIFIPILIIMLVFSVCADDEISIHGFMSQGFMKSNHNNYLAKSSEGSYEFNETAVNFYKEMDDNLSLGLQLFSRDMGDQGNNTFKLDWGFADYQVNDNYGFRLGKIKMPLGLHNTGRDVDLLRTEILMPQSVYEEGMRDFMNSVNGFSYYRNIFTEDKGFFEYEILSGTVNIEGDSAYMRNVVTNLSNTGLVLSDFNFTLYKDNGISLKWETPVEGLRLGYSYYEAEGDIVADVDASAVDAQGDLLVATYAGPDDTPGTADDVNTALAMQGAALIAGAAALEASPQKFAVEFPKIYTMSLEYMWDNYVLTHERRIHEATLHVPILDQMEGVNNLGYYTKIDYRINERLATSLYSSTFYENRHVKTTARDYQEDVCLSFKYDVKYNFSLKLEYHDMEGYYQCYNFLNPAGLEKDWNFMAFKATISF